MSSVRKATGEASQAGIGHGGSFLSSLWPRTMFGQQVLVLFGCLVATQVVFVFVIFGNLDRPPAGFQGPHSHAAFYAGVVQAIDGLPPAGRAALAESKPLAAAGIRWLPAGTAGDGWREFAATPGDPETSALSTLLDADYVLLRNSNDSRAGLLAVRLPDGSVVELRQSRPAPKRPGAWLPMGNMLMVTFGLLLGGYLVTRQVTRPLSRLVEAADAIGANVRAAPVVEEGPTETRQLANAFNVMRERLTRYLDSRSEMLAAMSHDLKTPLTRMRLRSEAVEDPALRERFVADLAEMDELVQSTLEMLCGQSGVVEFQPVNLAELLDEIAAEFREIGGQVTVNAAQLGPLAGHRLLLKRALANVIHNSIKYAGGAEVLAEALGPQIRILVSDRGPGIPESVLPHIFKPFYRVESSRNRSTGGTGLGLAIALDAVQLHHGSISVANRDGGGLEVEVTLPSG